jgi:hypothetical protein
MCLYAVPFVAADQPIPELVYNGTGLSLYGSGAPRIGPSSLVEKIAACLPALCL